MSRSYLLPCPCGKKTSVGSAQAGRKVSCVCGAELTVPTFRGLQDLEIVENETPIAVEPEWGGLRSLVFNVGAIVALAGLIGCGYFVSQMSKIDAKTIEKAVDNEITEHVDKMEPARAFVYWKLILDSSLDDKRVPKHIAEKRKYDWYRNRALGAAAAALLGAAASFAAARKN